MSMKEQRQSLKRDSKVVPGALDLKYEIQQLLTCMKDRYPDYKNKKLFKE